MAPLIVSRDFRGRLVRRTRRAGLTLDGALVDAIVAYVELLARWNRKINLTSIDQPEEAIDRLLIEPLLAARQLPASSPVRLIDIGSGGGSPAIPLKLARPDLVLTMVESKVRKSAFLREAVRHLSLDAVTVQTSRYEELLSRPDLHEAVDVVTIRAVRVEPRVLLGLQAFVRPGGRILLFRSASGGDVAASVPPPLTVAGCVPLVHRLRSQLVVLEKQGFGASAR